MKPDMGEDTPTTPKALKQKLAAIEHERWSDWQAWCHKIIRENDVKGLSVEDVLERWDRQIATPYSELSDEEKASDMEQVNRYWYLIQAYVTHARIKELEHLASFFPPINKFNRHLNLFIEAMVIDLEAVK